MPGSHHEARVRAWFGHEGSHASADLLVRRFEEGFTRLWARACPTLGEITLEAIADRVLHEAAARHAEVAEVKVDRSGLRSETLGGLREVEPDALEPMLREVLTQLLTVVGRLTAEILTPALHDELEEELEDDAAGSSAERAAPRDKPSEDDAAGSSPEPASPRDTPSGAGPARSGAEKDRTR